ncbi:hypothetical protein D9M68_361320 [compost metagenome]
MKALASQSVYGYRQGVAVNPAADLGRSNYQGTQAPSIRKQALFLCLQFRVMAAVRGTPSGVPVSLMPVGQPAYSCLPNSLGRERWQLLNQGVSPMNTRNPSAHASAWKARALSALRSNSSLSVRLRRYNEAMARARALEAQEVRHA